jgi:hypothetical protein
MLKAMLRRKLGRPRADGNGEDDEDASAFDYLTSREDPLTSSIFERLAYLDPGLAWRLLVDACEPKERLGDVAPLGAHHIQLWPHLTPAEGGRNNTWVEPDVLIEWGNLYFIVEAKHAGAQSVNQWFEQIQAAQAEARLKNREWFFVAASDTDPNSFHQLVAQLVEVHSDLSPKRFLLMRWSTLREALERLLPSFQASRPTQALIGGDMIAALQAWGYRRRVGFDTLPSVSVGLKITTTIETLKAWSFK